jgi:surface protein
MSGLFAGCSSLTTLDLSGFNTKNVTNMSGLFAGCSSLTTLDLSGFNTKNVTDMSGLFAGCCGLTSLDVSGFNTENVTNMRNMFSSCYGLSSLDVSGFDTGNVNNMSYMFAVCSGLSALNISGFDTSNVTDMSSMFRYCTGLSSLNLSNFDTSNVTDMSGMFKSCRGLTILDLSSFNTSNVIHMGLKYVYSHSDFDYEGMFYDCNILKTIYCGDGWNTENVINSADMFYKCINLVGGKGTTYDPLIISVSRAHVDGGPDNPGYLTLKGEDVPTEIDGIWSSFEDRMHYGVNGTRIEGKRHGIHIIRKKDGKNVKVVVK